MNIGQGKIEQFNRMKHTMMLWEGFSRDPSLIEMRSVLDFELAT